MVADPVPTPPTTGTAAPGVLSEAAPSPAPEARDTSRSRANRNGRVFGTGTDVRHAGSVALTPDEVRRLLAPIDRLEDRALLELAVTTGIRREDLVAIPLEGLDLDAGMLTFYESKKRRTRRLPLDGTALVTLRSYVRTLPKGGRWLFPSPRLKGRHETGRLAWNVLNRWLDVAGLPRRPFHALRATAYKLAKARGWSVEQAAALLGDTIRVAMEFYGVATPGELRETVRERPLL
jgi:integrase/recombinase XerD